MTWCRNQRLGAICRQHRQLRGVRDAGWSRQSVAQRAEERQHSQHAVVDGAGDETRSVYYRALWHNI